MKAVVYKDKHGYLRRVLIRDDDGLDMAEYGLPAGPPDVELIDWEAVKRDINNILVQGEVFNYTDLQSKRMLDSVAAVVKKQIARIYREKEAENTE
jgi:hypothetical protein